MDIREFRNLCADYHNIKSVNPNLTLEKNHKIYKELFDSYVGLKENCFIKINLKRKLLKLSEEAENLKWNAQQINNQEEK